MIVQLNPPLPLDTPKGSGIAHFLIDYGAEFDLYWTVFLDDSGECWTFSNREIRAQKNQTMGRPQTSPAEPVSPNGASNGVLRSGTTLRRTT